MADAGDRHRRKMDAEIKKSLKKWYNLDWKNLFTLERLKVLSNFTIAGAVVFTGITIQGKSFNLIVSTGSTVRPGRWK